MVTDSCLVNWMIYFLNYTFAVVLTFEGCQGSGMVGVFLGGMTFFVYFVAFNPLIGIDTVL